MSGREYAELTNIADQYDHFLLELKPVETDAELDPIVKFRSIRQQMRRLFARVAVIAAQLRHTLDTQKVALEDARAQEKRTKSAVDNIVTGGMVANLLIASLLSFLFLRDISRKLSALVKNAERLPKRLPLLEPLPGSDELSYLDGALHTAADDLKKAFDHRASLMQMVAHDLRSPLTSAQISLDLIQATEADSLSAKSFQYIEKIGTNNRMVLDLINDLLTVDALELGQMEINPIRVSIKSIVAEAVTAMSGLASIKKIEIADFSADEFVSADAKRIVQVLINLLTNAIKFSANGSSIKIMTACEGAFVEVAVVDRGVGMSTDDCRHVFDKFYQTAEGRCADGFGLGLAICKLIVTSHAGQIGVTSNPGQGSRFWFRLKAARNSQG
ncbi:MAG: HAMP domain-containing sensor histidine kinase [Candidatus Obscuribacterales bacterium]|nr:HAMP domain-containing sensor histidine kinase [Candidatus Obscuribacterales bacterium]